MNIEKLAETDSKQIVEFILGSIIHGEGNLGMPRYIDWIKSEADCEKIHILPIIYVGNENKKAGTFSLSINSKGVGYLLEPLISTSNPQFDEIRDKIVSVLRDISLKQTVDLCQKFGKYPSDLFAEH